MAMLKDLIVSGGGVILGALKCKEINSSGEIKADNVSLNNGIVTLGGTNQIYQFPSGQYIINITTKIYGSTTLSILDTITIRRMYPACNLDVSYTFNISGRAGYSPTLSDYSILNNNFTNYGRAKITMSDIPIPSIRDYMGEMSCTMSFDGAIRDNEILLIEYNSCLTNITIT